jgi:hypothetical protein
MKTYEIYNSVSYYDYSDWGKRVYKTESIGFITATEDDVKSLVDEINIQRNSLYPKYMSGTDPMEEDDSYLFNFDYILYREIKSSTIDEIKNNFYCKHRNI